MVGKLYRLDIIDGSMIGSLLHWAIRFIVFVALFLLGSFVIWIVKLITAVPIWLWFTLLVVGLISVIIHSYKESIKGTE
ncbi:hypothetical protein DCMF_19885 [Candidatus Formimonas warabiya]|uniref:Uncharacterized protein n=1 Tax=Formimonas warabiya TaxID=1761012 RepID=A0A3G1KWH9_FORW1|nr:hypothetical protein DCMF_19885 [Candidatus Formimonas warabiya]